MTCTRRVADIRPTMVLNLAIGRQALGRTLGQAAANRMTLPEAEEPGTSSLELLLMLCQACKPR